ncbi:DNA repair protein RAD51 homolog 3-like [Nematolebias whitei]|uniref:DNA repair protein RAD51 homolog 3-like n=1 Tax=Nematolebias whitei TaxID=451745 RepID=UPI001898026F|nr:DNA repair protein RAD51 homolog 3-like [Nematolebias whitei]
MKRPLSSLNLCTNTKMKLGRAGFQYTSDLHHLNPEQVSQEAGVSQQEALQVLQAVRTGCGGASLSALELLQKEESFRSIITFCSQLDSALGGGLPVEKITEICGVPGVGKTQLW